VVQISLFFCSCEKGWRLAEDNVPGISAAVQAGGEKPDKGLDITLAHNNNQI